MLVKCYLVLCSDVLPDAFPILLYHFDDSWLPVILLRMRSAVLVL